VLSTQFDVEATSRQLNQLRDDVDELLTRLSVAESTWSHWLTGVSDEYQASARNMLHYWAIRQCDLRDLQARLSANGLSSLGRSEPHVEATLLLVRSAICAMLGDVWQQPAVPGVRIDRGPELLRHRTQDLLGPEPVDRVTRIMVTLPSSAATNPAVVRQLVERGMNIARINCAHDDAEAWRSMAGHVRQAADATGQGCLIAMDLAGPKLRTGPLEPGPRSVKLRPHRNKLGKVISPAQAWLTAAEDPIDPPEAGMLSLPVSRQWLRRRHNGATSSTPGWVVVEVDETVDTRILQLGVEEAQLRGAPLRVITAWRSRFTDIHDVHAASEGNRLVGARLDRSLACWRRRYPDLDLRSVAVNGNAVGYLAKHAADIQLVVVGCGDRSDVGDLLGPTGSAALHDTDCSLLICDRHQRL
jgi:hypothetical protein